MAEAIEILDSNLGQKEKGDNMECAVCLQKCIHPAQLPCGHIFCFLCVKGFANQNKRCAMCRQEIPRDFIDQPHLLEPVVPEKAETFDDGFQWFYEGRSGWWQYDERTSKDLEISYKNNEKTCELLIAGFLYIIDLENMLQIRRNDPSRRRRIKRDYSTVVKKGIAGIHQNKQNDRFSDNIAVQNLQSLEETTINALESDNSSGGTQEEAETLDANNDDDDALESTLQRLNNLHLNSIH